MDNLRHHRQRAHRAGADAGDEQQVGEIRGTIFRRRCQRAVQAAENNIARPHVVMRRHDEMRQQRFGECRIGSACRVAGVERGELARDAVRAER